MADEQFSSQTCATLRGNQKQREALLASEATLKAQLKDVREQIADIDSSTYGSIEGEDPEGTVFGEQSK